MRPAEKRAKKEAANFASACDRLVGTDWFWTLGHQYGIEHDIGIAGMLLSVIGAFRKLKENLIKCAEAGYSVDQLCEIGKLPAEGKTASLIKNIDARERGILTVISELYPFVDIEQGVEIAGHFNNTHHQHYIWTRLRAGETWPRGLGKAEHWPKATRW